MLERGGAHSNSSSPHRESKECVQCVEKFVSHAMSLFPQELDEVKLIQIQDSPERPCHEDTIEPI